MKLHIGQRLTNVDMTTAGADATTRIKQRNAGIYLVKETLVETPWYGLYRGTKVFRNVLPTQELKETDESEHLDVLLKTIAYTKLDDRQYVKARRDQVRFEMRRVLGCNATNLLPEPIDYFETQNTLDPFTFGRAAQIIRKEPILVFENISGHVLAKWMRSENPSLRRRLHVATEILGFIQTLHNSKLIANNIGPTSFWIDGADRVYFLATDAVIAVDSGTTICQLFPPERFSQGFAPHEAFAPNKRLDHVSDLYSWATLAYYLITNESPAQLAIRQRNRAATFAEEQTHQLTASLTDLPRTDIDRVKSWLDVTGNRFATSYPNGFVTALMACLQADRQSRPHSVIAFRDHCAAPPPPRIPLAIAVKTVGNSYQLRFETAGLNGQAQLVVRQSKGQVAINPNDGIEVYDGPIVESLEITLPKNQGATCLAAFVRESVDGRVRHSSGTGLFLIDASCPKAWLDYVEELARNNTPATSSPDQTTLPALLKLIGACRDVTVLLRPLFSSKLKTVHQWGVMIVNQQLLLSRDSELIQLLWDLGLTNRLMEVRLAAAAGIFGHVATPPIDLVIRVAKVIGGGALDDWIRGARALSGCSVRADVIEAAVKRLEADRLLTCKFCSSRLRAGDLDQHLRQQHGFIDVDGKPVSRSAAIKRLWKSVFHNNDITAAERLADIFVGQSAGATDALNVPLLLNCRLSWLPEQLSSGIAEQHRRCRELAVCLRDNPLMRRACWAFVTADESELRELGREVLMPQFAPRLDNGNATIEEFRRTVDALCRYESLDVKISTCLSLANCGASLELAKRCAEDYELDRPQRCSFCDKSLALRDLPSHERQTHDCYRYEGQSWNWQDLSEQLCRRLVVSDQPSLSDAQLCADILRERIDVHVFNAVFAERLVAVARPQPSLDASSQAADTLDMGDASTRVHLAGSTLAQLPDAVSLANALFSRPELFATELAFAICGSQAIPSTRELLQGSIVGLHRKDVAPALRHTAVVAIVREFIRDPGVLRPLLSAYVQTAPNKLEGSKQLGRLRTDVGELVVINELCDELEATVRLRCPFCQAVMSGLEMRAHAELTHRKVWKNHRLNDPWTLAEQCLDDYLIDSDAALLVAGERYAAITAKDEGVERFYRAALDRHIDVTRYKKLLVERAKKNGTNLCCACWSELPSPAKAAFQEIAVSDKGRLSSEFLSIENSDSLLFREVNIVEHATAWTGQQPPATLSFQGVCMLVAATFSAGLLGIIVLAIAGFSVIWPFGLWLVGAAASAAAVTFYRSREESVMVIAWRQVVPELLKRQADPKAIAFLSGLARKTIGRRDLKCEPQVRDATPKFLQWYKSGIASHGQLAMIYQLALNQHTCGRHYLSAVSTLLELFELWMDGEIPSECLDLITKNGELLQQLPTAEARLLRWRFLRACSIRGYSRVDTLALASRAATFSRLFTWPGTLPTRLLALAFAIQRLDDGDSFRTIFDLAEDGNAKAVEWAELNDAGAESAGGDITVRGDGLFVKGMAITQRPEIRITANQHFVQTGWTYQRVDGGPDLRYNNNPPRGYNETVDYSLYINGREFRYASDPSQLKEIIHRCSATYFDRIVPQLNRDFATAQPPDGQRRVCCPHCGTWQTA